MPNGKNIAPVFRLVSVWYCNIILRCLISWGLWYDGFPMLEKGGFPLLTVAKHRKVATNATFSLPQGHTCIISIMLLLEDILHYI